MRKIFTSALFLALVFAFSACDNGGDDGGSTSQATKVSGTITDMPAGSDYAVELVYYDEGDKVVLATAAVSGGSFSLTLPATVDPSYLEPITAMEDSDTDLTFSNSKAKILPNVYLELYQGDEYIDDVVFCKFDIDDEAQTAYMVLGALTYCDSDSKVTGTVPFDDGHTASVNLDLKKGWNWGFQVANINGDNVSAQATTKSQSGLAFYLENETPF